MSVDWYGEPEDTSNVPSNETVVKEENDNATETATVISETIEGISDEPEQTKEEIVPDESVTSNASDVVDIATEANANSQGKTIALIDSGVNGDLADASVNLTNDPDVDNVGHGTRMAQVIKNISGDNASVLSIKAFNDDGTGSISTVTFSYFY